MLIITSDFDMDWPDQVKSIFSIADPINALTNAIVNFDCFMDVRKIEEVEQFNFTLPEGEMRVAYQKVMIMSSLPIVLAALAYIIWWVISRIKKTMAEM